MVGGGGGSWTVVGDGWRWWEVGAGWCWMVLVDAVGHWLAPVGAG